MHSTYATRFMIFFGKTTVMLYVRTRHAMNRYRHSHLPVEGVRAVQVLLQLLLLLLL